MEKIMKALLEAKHPTLDANTILEIASMTPNAKLAVEKLCGIYEPCGITQGEMRRDNHSGIIQTVTAIQEWENRVHYSYVREKTVGIYIPNDIDENVVTYENYKSYECNYQGGGKTKYIYLKTGVIETAMSSCEIEEWLTREIVQD
jgi:hypothetical protein